MTHGFEIVLLALTVWGESRSESYKGKLGVAYVICNRMRSSKVRISRVVLKAWQFSFYNTGDPSRDDISDIDPNSPSWSECLKSACSAYFELEVDPTGGAVFYLNKKTVLATAGKLPSWWEIDGDPASERQIGLHSFRRHK